MTPWQGWNLLVIAVSSRLSSIPQSLFKFPQICFLAQIKTGDGLETVDHAGFVQNMNRNSQYFCEINLNTRGCGEVYDNIIPNLLQGRFLQKGQYIYMDS